MSYQEKPLKKLYNGKEVVPLSVGKEILDIRSQIESNFQHAGGQLELVHKAYSEIQTAHGHHPTELRPSCSACTYQMNKMLSNWFKLYDKGSLPQKAMVGGVKSKPLVPIKEKKKVKIAKDLSNKTTPALKQATPSKFSSMSYAELLEEFDKVASESDKSEINKGNKPKKAQLINYFNGK